MNEIPVIDIVLAAIAILLAVGWLVNLRRTHRILAVSATQLQELSRLQNEVRALNSGAVGMGSHLARVEQQLKRITDRQHQFEVREPTAQVYDHAVKLARNGADVEELMTRCGLVRDEAELLLRMHRFRDAG